MLPAEKKPTTELEEAFRQSLRERGELHPEARQVLYEDLRLQFDYPGKYVVFMDRWKGRGSSRTLDRQILAHSTSLVEVQGPLDRLSPRDRAKAVLRYATDPYQPEVHS